MEGYTFVVEDDLTSRGVRRGAAAADDCSFAYVCDLDEIGDSIEGGGGGYWELPDFEILLAVQKHALIVVRDDFGEVVGWFGVILEMNVSAGLEIGQDRREVSALTVGMTPKVGSTEKLSSFS